MTLPKTPDESTAEPLIGERRSAALLATAQRVLWPLVKLLLHRGVTYPTFAEAVKTLYVRVALAEFPLRGKRETDSRLSVLTGIYRRDVKRIRDEADASAADEAGARSTASRIAEISLASMVVARWTGEPRYLDANGAPKPLARLASKGGDESFEALVATINKDVRARALLDEWLRRGAVTRDEDDRIALNLDAFIAHRTVDEKSFYFGQNVHDHMAAAAHNLMGGTPPYLERCVYYGRLKQESVDELQALAQKAAMEALQKVNRRAMALQAADASSPEANRRMNFGTYFYAAGRRPGSDTDGNE